MNSKNKILRVLGRGFRVALISLLALSFLATSPTRAADLPNLTIDMTLTGGNLIPLETGRTYSILVTNIGDVSTTGPATVVFSHVTVPAGLTVTAISGTDWDCNLGTLTCTRSDELVSQASYDPITVTVTVLVGAPPEITSQAVVSGGGSDDDPDNNTSSPISNVDAKADLIITGYQLLNADKSAVITQPNPNQTFWVRMTIQNQGGVDTSNFYPGVFLDDKPNYGPDHNTDGITLPLGYPTLTLGETTDYQGYKVTGANAQDPAGCVYYDPNNQVNTATTEVVSERGNYHPVNFLPGLPAGSTSIYDVEIAYPEAQYVDPIYDNIRTGLPAGSYTFYIYADPNCNIDEVTETNNSFGPISINTKSYFASAATWTTDFSYQAGWRVESHPRVVGDVDNDGDDDLIGFFDNGVWVGLSNGSNGFTAMTKWTTSFSPLQGWETSKHPRMVGDVNGDGRVDLVGFGYDGVWVSLSTGSGFGPLSRWATSFTYNQGWRIEQHPRMVGDVNGDNMADLIGFGNDGVWVALSTGIGFNTYTKWTSSLTSLQGWETSKHPRMVGDVNGDGKADLKGFGYDGVWATLSTGTGFGSLSKWATSFTYNQGWRIEQHPRMVGDVNGDGKVDIVGFGNDGVWVSRSTGTGFDIYTKWSSDFTYNQGWYVNLYPRILGDVNGDGADDLVGFGSTGVMVGIAE